MSKLGGTDVSQNTHAEDIVQAGGQVDSVVAGANVTVDNTDPANPIVSSTGGGGGGQVDSVVAGTNVTVDVTDPVNPVVNAAAAPIQSITMGTNMTNSGTTSDPILDAAGGGSTPTTTQGDIIQRGASADERLAIGTALQVLQVNAGATALEYVEPSSGGGGGGAPFSGALVTHSLAQTVFGTAALTFDTETYDVGGWHDGVNPTRLTVPAGVTRVRLTGAMQDTTSVTGQFICAMSKNGVATFVGASAGETESAGGDNAGWASPVVDVVAGDFFECTGFATTSRTTNADGRTYFSIEAVEQSAVSAAAGETFETSDTTTVFSGSTNATKGCSFDCNNNITVNSVEIWTGTDASATYDCVIAEVSGATDVIDAITGTSDATSTANGAPTIKHIFKFASGVALVAAKRYAFLLVRKDGTGTAICRVGYNTIVFSDDNLSYISGCIEPTNLPAVSQAIRLDTANTASMIIKYTVD